MLRSLGRCCLGKVDLLVAGGAAEMLLVPLISCPLALLITHPLFLLVCCFFVFVEMGETSTASGRLEVNLLLSEKRLLLPTSMQTKQDPRKPVLLMALKIVLHATLCSQLSYFLFACAGIQKGYARHCLVEVRGGKLGLLSA